jgi:hypothetical protein
MFAEQYELKMKVQLSQFSSKQIFTHSEQKMSTQLHFTEREPSPFPKCSVLLQTPLILLRRACRNKSPDHEATVV